MSKLKLASDNIEKVTTDDSLILFESEIYLSNLAFNNLIEKIRTISGSCTLESANLKRRACRLLELAEGLKDSGLYVTTNEFSRVLRTETYRLLEEIATFFSDQNDTSQAQEIKELLHNELANEIVTTLMARTGRQQSAAVLAIRYGLIADDYAVEILTDVGLTPKNFARALKASFHDLTEIQATLQFQGDFNKILNEQEHTPANQEDYILT